MAVAAAFGANPLFYAVITDVVPHSAGTAMGIMNSGLAAAGFLAPVVTGFILQATGSFDFRLLADRAAHLLVGRGCPFVPPPRPRRRPDRDGDVTRPPSR